MPMPAVETEPLMRGVDEPAAVPGMDENPKLVAVNLDDVEAVGVLAQPGRGDPNRLPP